MNKKQLIASLVGIVAAVSAIADTGAFAFKNTTAPKPLIKGLDGVTGIAGSSFSIGVLVKDPSTGNYTDVGLLKNGGAYVTATPLTGGNAGLFTGGVITVPFLKPGDTASVIVRAWDNTGGATFATSTANGSVSFDIPNLGAGAGSTVSTALPADMSASFPGFSLKTTVPEPSTYALAALGLGGLLLFRRK
jgi:hypothetical protein